MAELLLIKDQYELAFHSLNRGLSAEEGGKKDEALMYYRKGHMHLTQGVEVPTAGPRQHGAVWDTARQLQQKMRDTLQTVNGHLSDLQSSQVTPVPQRSLLLKNLDPPKSSLNHLYPTVPTTNQNTTPTPKTPPPRPPSPAVLHTHTLPAAAPGTTAMANTGEQPPVYTLQPTAGHRSLSYSPAAGGGGGLQTGAAAGRDGHELIFIPSGVQMFFVAPNGQVSSLSYPGFLRIITFENQKKDVTGGRPSAFLHVCDCLYPLTTDTPVLLANSGVYMFPDCMAKVPGSYVGIVLSSELPAADREMFKDILSQMAELRIQGPVGSDVINLSEKIPLGTPGGQTMLVGPTGEKEKLLPGWSEKMAQGILSGATKVSHQLVRGAEATGRAIHRGASKIRDHITPEDTPSEVSPSVTRSLYVAKKATGGAVRVSQFLVNGVSSVAGHVAEKVAPHVKKHGAKLVPESLKSKDGQPSNVDGAKHVAASGVHGFSAIWTSLETGAKLIGKSVASETVMCVTYKYGNDTGAATDTALKSVINVAVAAHNIDNLGIKAILKTTGKQAAKAMVKSPNGKTAETQAKEAQKREHQPDNNMEFTEKGEEEKKKKL